MKITLVRVCSGEGDFTKTGLVGQPFLDASEGLKSIASREQKRSRENLNRLYRGEAFIENRHNPLSRRYSAFRAFSASICARDLLCVTTYTPTNTSRIETALTNVKLSSPQRIANTADTTGCT